VGERKLQQTEGKREGKEDEEERNERRTENRSDGPRLIDAAERHPDEQHESQRALGREHDEHVSPRSGSVRLRNKDHDCDLWGHGTPVTGLLTQTPPATPPHAAA